MPMDGEGLLLKALIITRGPGKLGIVNLPQLVEVNVLQLMEDARLDDLT